jgi:hypothetical protein
MSTGYVYILLNPALKGQVKIGRTTNSPEERAAELSTTGLPHDFIVAYAERVSDCDTVERALHERFADARVSPNREFFRVPLQAAIRALIEISKRYCVDEPQGVDETTYSSLQGRYSSLREMIDATPANYDFKAVDESDCKMRYPHLFPKG